MFNLTESKVFVSARLSKDLKSDLTPLCHSKPVLLWFCGTQNVMFGMYSILYCFLQYIKKK